MPKTAFTAKESTPIAPPPSNPEVIPVVKPRLVKLTIRNFRCIGPKAVEIDLDDIVVLVGANNAGKSSILKAYEIVMSDGSKKGELTLDDFPENKVDPTNLPQIELHTIVYDEGVGSHWIKKVADNEYLVKERWTWNGVGKPKRQGWDVTTNDWHPSSFPFGPANIANARRPEPHRVDAFDAPEVQADAIKKLLKQALEERVKNLKNEDGANDYKALLEQVKNLQKKIVSEAKQQIDAVNTELTSLITKVFPNYKIDFDAKPEDNLDKTINLFKEDSRLLMGPEGGHLSTVDMQGSGARRTLLWTALKFISENGKKDEGEENVNKAHLLLIDEPEICLHPNAIRDACNVLYDLPTKGNWQVMVTTHSPVFIDFSRDNTTIVRVEKIADGSIQSTTVFKPDTVRLDADDKKNLKMLNLCDPYVAEFFFGGKTIVVEGDTEYTAFKYVVAKDFDKYRHVHIIRARGKATIVSLIKILNQFGSGYSVLHDSDSPTIQTKTGEKVNGAWTTNQNILDAFNSKGPLVKARLLASLPNFEKAYFGEETEQDKPYSALKTIEGSPEKFEKVEKLLDALIDPNKDVPAGCLNWSNLDQLKTAITG